MKANLKNNRLEFNERIVIPVILMIGVFLATLFSLRASQSLIHLQAVGFRRGPAGVDTVRGWMTLPYVAKAYQVPEGYLYQQAGLPPTSDPHLSLDGLNRQFYPGQPGVLTDRVKTAISNFRNSNSHKERPKNGFNI